MHSIRNRMGVLMIVAAVAGAGCDALTDPLNDFDPQATAEALETMTATADGLDDAFGSLSAASSVFGETGASLLASRTPVHPDAEALLGLRDLTAADFFPAEYLGTTFEWHEGEMAYIPSDATGAPEDGVRIIYYAIDPTTGHPASPLNALGHVDLHDQSTDTSDRLGIEVVRTSGGSDVTLADYYLDISFTITQSSFTADIASVGYLSNGTDQLNFDLAQGASFTETEATFSQSYELGLEGTDIGMTFTATVTGDPQSESEEPENLDAEATINNGTDEARIEVMYANDALTGTMYHNGDAVVLIAGDLDQPTFTDTDGDPLTEEQIQALRDLWDELGNGFDFMERIFGFAA